MSNRPQALPQEPAYAPLALGVIVERRPAASPWLDHVWRVVGLLPGGADRPPWSVLVAGDRATRYYAGTATLALHRVDTALYKHNLEGPCPSVYVVLRRARTATGWTLLLATVDPAEAHAHADIGDDLVEALPMPAAVAAWLGSFIAAHHVERGHWRRRRDRADPEALAARPPRGRRQDAGGAG